MAMSDRPEVWVACVDGEVMGVTSSAESAADSLPTQKGTWKRVKVDLTEDEFWESSKGATAWLTCWRVHV